jgi:hypothetical protein
VLPVQRQAAGPHVRELPLTGLAPGIYLVRMQAADHQQTIRLVVGN